MELDGWTEEQVRVFLREQPEETVRSAVRDLGADDVLPSIFTGMAGRFATDRRRGPGRLLLTRRLRVDGDRLWTATVMRGLS